MRSYFLKNKIAASGLVGVPSVPAMNQVVPPLPLQPATQEEPINADAGATGQKSMVPPVQGILPKTAQANSRIPTMNVTPRFLLHDLVKEAQARAMDRVRIAQEASYQMKQASDSEDEKKDKDKKAPCKEGCSSKMGSAEEVTTDYAMKLAAAVEFAIPHIEKMAAPNAPPPHMTENVQRPGEGPGALRVMESAVAGAPPGPGQQGAATSKNQSPKDPALQASNVGPANQMDNTMDSPPGGTGVQTTAMPAGQGKTAAALAQSNYAILRKMAEPTAEDVLGGAATGGAIGGGLGTVGGGLAGGLTAAHYAPAIEQALKARNMPGIGRAAALAAPIAGTALGATAGGLGGMGLGGLIGGVRGAVKGGAEEASPEQLDALAQQAAAKQASAPATMVDAFLSYIKQAEDAINPAHISAGPAVPPDATASGEGVPAKPSGASMVDSTESAINYNKQQAKAEPKRDMSAYVSEPALSAAHDSTLQQVFSHTGQAGVKISSADAAMRVSAARELLSRIAEAANNK